MAESILQTYLNNQFIKTAEQDNITKLKAAATEVKKRLIKKKIKIISYTLIALDPIVSEDEPIVTEVEKIIISKWTTFRNSVSPTKDKPINYIRAVIFEALNSLAKDENYAAIIWLTGRNVVSHYKLGNESIVIEDFLKNIGRKVEEASRIYWGISNVRAVKTPPSVKIDISKVSAAKIKEASLAENLQIASQYSGWSQYGGGGTNPSSLNNQNWAPHFSTNAAKAIAFEVNNGFTEQNKSLNTITNSIQKELENYFLSIQPYYEQLSTNLLQGLVANNKRSELLWWKQSLYSPILNKSYRQLTQLEAAIAMAVDLSNFVAPIYPASVDYILMETLKDVFGDEVDSQVALADILKEASDLNQNFKELVHTLVKVIPGRKPLGIALANHLITDIDNDVFLETGIDKKATVSLTELTTWIFHDLQSVKLASIKL